MELTGQDKVVELFMRAARELRAMGATRVEGLGFVANFGPGPVERPSVVPAEPERALSAEARELQARAQKWAGGER